MLRLLATFGESQANLRDEQREAKKNGTFPAEYGFFNEAYELGSQLALRMPVVGTRLKAAAAAARAIEVQQQKDEEPTPVDRIEARQLELADKVCVIQTVLAELSPLIKTLSEQQLHHLQLLQVTQPAKRSEPAKVLSKDDRRTSSITKVTKGKERPPREVGSGSFTRAPTRSADRTRSPPDREKLAQSSLKQRSGKDLPSQAATDKDRGKHIPVHSTKERGADRDKERSKDSRKESATQGGRHSPILAAVQSVLRRPRGSKDLYA